MAGTCCNQRRPLVISGDRAWWFYFRSPENEPRARTAAIYVAELTVPEGALPIKDPGSPIYVDLKSAREPEK